jgi:phosphoenolpyruvate carboxylase
MPRPSALPKALRQLVHDSVELLGEVIQAQVGQAVYRKIDSLRQEMVAYRSVSLAEKEATLNSVMRRMRKTSPEQQALIAHSFTLMFELINTCENAYRTYRLQRNQQCIEEQPRSDNMIVFVLTAHPTEARDSANIGIFQQIGTCCLDLLNHSTAARRQQLKHLLKLAWLIPVGKHSRPTVEDEARHIFSIVLRPDILDTLLHLQQHYIDIRIRTWVGGDKDGHPGVDEKVMCRVMQLSRDYFIPLIEQKLKIIETDLNLLEKPLATVKRQLVACTHKLHSLKKLLRNDGQRIIYFSRAFRALEKSYIKAIGEKHPRLDDIDAIITIFPGLIIPLELREQASLIHRALKNKRSMPIARMLAMIKELGWRHPDFYSKELIISMTESVEDIVAAFRLVKKHLKSDLVRVVPLFETQSALNRAPDILNTLLKRKATRALIREHWNNKFEVMLGYSDSAKGMGMLCSRLAIADCIAELDTIYHRHGITPVFFHGSGGSVDRGGGSIEEQTAWWPPAAFNIIKSTVQGEMVERNFATPEITAGIIHKLIDCSRHAKTKKFKQNKLMRRLAELTCARYQETIENPLFLDIVNKATAYPYLNQLKLGSRPSKRQAGVSIESLRAIPWILCWTQTRVLFPTWWGIGSAWQALKQSGVTGDDLQKLYKQNALFRSFVKLLGFTLSKVELPIWNMYLKHSTLTASEVETAVKAFQQEYRWACQFVRQVSGKRDLLWFRPWLKESVHLRYALINPLNIIQIIALENNDGFLIRETVTGIASGMLTTG